MNTDILLHFDAKNQLVWKFFRDTTIRVPTDTTFSNDFTRTTVIVVEAAR